MNQLISTISKQKILSLVLVLMFLVPVISFAQGGEVTPIGGPSNIIQDTLYSLVNGLFGWLVWASGILLNYSVKEYVVGFGAGFRDSGLGFAVNNLWVTVRDIFNLTFIFGLVYIGFKMILNNGDSNARRMLVSLILAALLVNFSLFITKFVIDFSNIAATQFAAAFSSTSGTEVNYNLTDKFMQLTGLSSVWDIVKGGANSLPNGGSAWAYIFGSLILYLVMAFVFFAGAILLIIRYVVLNIYMILSPIMFLGLVFPGFSSASQKYWSGFLQRAFFAPAYLLMLFFAAKVLESMSIPSKKMGDAFIGSGDQSPAIATQSFEETIPYFILTCAFLIAAIVVAQKMGAEGAGNAMKLGQRLSGGARRLVTGGAANLALKGVDKMTANDGRDGQRNWANRGTRMALRGVGKAANYAGVRGGLEEAAKPWTTSNHISKTKAGIAERDKVAKNAGMIEAGTNHNNVRDLAAIRTKQSSGLPLTQAERANLYLLEKEEAEMRTVIANMNTAQLEKMSSSDREKIAHLLTESQTENLHKSDKISEKDKESLSDARKKAIEKVIGTGNSIIGSELTKLSVNQIETMGDQWINQNSHQLTHSQFEEVKKSKKFTEAQKNSFGASRKRHYDTMAASPVNAQSIAQFDSLLATAKPNEIAKLPANILLRQESMKYITDDVLKKIATEGYLTPSEQKRLQTQIVNNPGSAHRTAAGYFSTNHANNNWA